MFQHKEKDFSFLYFNDDVDFLKIKIHLGGRVMHSITIQDFQAIVGNEDVVVLDIRDKAAIAEFSLPNTVAMTTTSLPNRLNELNAETQYYVLSHSGRRSEIIAEFLRNNGFKATHIIGGVKAFKKAA
ncbi:hypothetical protein RT42_GL001162 [Enterococcus cecorum DSM 20682 = ATCC 43198]|nr:hypothetical protein RT42_GL001162 [Enterococcus cecorum DSM 20682 = ATCC 43198]